MREVINQYYFKFDGGMDVQVGVDHVTVKSADGNVVTLYITCEQARNLETALRKFRGDDDTDQYSALSKEHSALMKQYEELQKIADIRDKEIEKLCNRLDDLREAIRLITNSL